MFSAATAGTYLNVGRHGHENNLKKHPSRYSINDVEKNDIHHSRTDLRNHQIHHFDTAGKPDNASESRLNKIKSFLLTSLFLSIIIGFIILIIFVSMGGLQT
jgi:hypothetical protein